MRSILAVLVLCVLSLPALGAPAVGDKMHQVGQATVNGQTVGVTFDKEVISFDPNLQQFTIRSTTTVTGGQPSISNSTINATDMFSHEKIQGLLANCAAYGGARAMITIATQTFDTCALPFTSSGCQGTIWIGDVPFAEVMEKASCPSQGITDLEFPGGAAPEIAFQWAQGV